MWKIPKRVWDTFCLARITARFNISKYSECKSRCKSISTIIIKKHTFSKLVLWTWRLASPWPCRSSRIPPIRHSQILMTTNTHHKPVELTLCHITSHSRTYNEGVRSVSLTKVHILTPTDISFIHPPQSGAHTHTRTSFNLMFYICKELLHLWLQRFTLRKNTDMSNSLTWILRICT